MLLYFRLGAAASVLRRTGVENTNRSVAEVLVRKVPENQQVSCVTSLLLTFNFNLTVKHHQDTSILLLYTKGQLKQANFFYVVIYCGSLKLTCQKDYAKTLTVDFI